MAYRFFLSCAEQDCDQNLDAFFADLAKAVGDAVNPQSDLGYYFKHQLRVGNNWKNNVLEAVASCDIFIPNYSTYFFASPGCGKEIGVFVQRLATHGADEEDRFLVPLIWGPPRFVTNRIPKRFQRFQFYDNRAPALYRDNGLLRLMQMKSAAYQDAYTATVHWLADRLAEIINSLDQDDPAPALPPWRPPAAADGDPWDGVANLWEQPSTAESFASNPGPRLVHVVFLIPTSQEVSNLGVDPDRYAASSQDWRPFAPGNSLTIHDLAYRATAAERLVYSSLTVSTDLDQSIAEAVAANNVLIVLTDATAYQLPRYADVVPRCPGSHSVFLLLQSAGYQELEQQRAKRRFLEALDGRQAAITLEPGFSEADLRTAFVTALHTAVGKISQNGEVARAATGNRVIARPIL